MPRLHYIAACCSGGCSHWRRRAGLLLQVLPVWHRQLRRRCRQQHALRRRPLQLIQLRRWRLHVAARDAKSGTAVWAGHARDAAAVAGGAAVRAALLLAAAAAGGRRRLEQAHGQRGKGRGAARRRRRRDAAAVACRRPGSHHHHLPLLLPGSWGRSFCRCSRCSLLLARVPAHDQSGPHNCHRSHEHHPQHGWQHDPKDIGAAAAVALALWRRADRGQHGALDVERRGGVGCQLRDVNCVDSNASLEDANGLQNRQRYRVV